MELNKQNDNLCENNKVVEINDDKVISHVSNIQPLEEVHDDIPLSTSQLNNNQSNNELNTSINNTCKNDIVEANVDSLLEKRVWIPPQKRNPSITREESITRQVNSMLNKLTIEKFETITDKIAVVVETSTSIEELRLIANLVLDKAVIEPDWSEMYADLCQVLKWRAPQFESMGKSSFSTCLLSKIQYEYECMPRELSPYTNDDVTSHRLKKRLLGIVKIIGELFLRKMFGFKVINSLVIDLVILRDEPFEHFIECFLQLIYTTGYYIEQSSYNPALDMWFGRLTELMGRKVYSKRIKYVMQDVIDLRNSNWKKNVHRDTAKALSELRYQIEAEDIVGGHHLAAQYGNIVTVGQRSNINSNLAYGNYMRSQEALANERKERSIIKPGLEKIDSFTFPLIDFKYSFVDAAPVDNNSGNLSPNSKRILKRSNIDKISDSIDGSQIYLKDKHVYENVSDVKNKNGRKIQNDFSKRGIKQNQNKSKVVNSSTTKNISSEVSKKDNRSIKGVKEPVQDEKLKKKIPNIKQVTKISVDNNQGQKARSPKIEKMQNGNKNNSNFNSPRIQNGKVASAKKHLTNTSGISIRGKKKSNFKALDTESELPRIEDLTVS